MQERTILEIVERIGKAIISREHEHFCEEPLDNNEHIPRVRRVVETIECELHQFGISRETARCLSMGIKDYGKELFMKTWVEDLKEDECEEEVLEEGAYEFDSIYQT